MFDVISNDSKRKTKLIFNKSNAFFRWKDDAWVLEEIPMHVIRSISKGSAAV